MRHILLLLLLGFAVTFTSCRDDFEFEDSTGGLQFSKDTVYLDTVFSKIGSSTYTLKVYNRSNKDIKIPSIQLGEGESSKYRLMVDGVPGKVFNNVELLAKDSMFVFIETTIDYSEYANNSTTFLYTDNIQFNSSNGSQKVELVTLVQDAVFMFPQRDNDGNYEAVRYDSDLNNETDPQYLYGFNLNPADEINGNELHFTNDKPYVIYGYATVPQGQTLTVDPGARVHFHADSGLMVRPGATLNINGAVSSDEKLLENEVIFEGDRLEPDFSDVAGQWTGVLLMSGADNTINHLTLKNANIGVFAQAALGDETTVPKLTVNNTQIYNCTNFGILASFANITGENVVANNAGQASVALISGGTYNFKYCTFANYFNSFNQVPLLINDYRNAGEKVYVGAVNANFDNCIIYGSSNVALSMERKYPSDADFKTKFNACIIKVIDFTNQLNNNPLYPGTSNNPALADYSTSLLEKTFNGNNPKFADPRNNKLFIITGDSAADGKADATVPTQFTTDVVGISRTGTPDIGAYASREAAE
jgi:hypothetical protein